MSNKKITVQDIADELGISRNTVSKALNNTGTLADATKSKIIEKAIEMGYKQFAYVNNTSLFSSNVSVNKEIALLTRSMPNSSHFGSHLLSGFEEKISTQGYRLSMYVIRDNELNSSSLPFNFNPETVDGIICIEMFDKNYSERICELGLPTLFIDSPSNHDSSPVNADILLTESYHSIYNITKTLINHNKTIGFVGDIYHCESFYERWKGYCSALLDSKIPFDINNSILENDKEPYGNPEWLGNRIMQIPVLPQAFICANDFIAISVIKALKYKNMSVPGDVLICGFDDSMESKIIEPHLTTVSIPSYEMGDIAANLLLSRIDNPSIPFRTMHVRTLVKFRESTGNILNEKNY